MFAEPVTSIYKAVQIVFFSLDFQNWTFDFELKPLFIIIIIILLYNWRNTKRETIDRQNENDFYFSEFNIWRNTKSAVSMRCWQYHHSECWCLFVMIKLFKFMERFDSFGLLWSNLTHSISIKLKNS